MRFVRKQTRRIRALWLRFLPRQFRRWKHHSQLVFVCLSITIMLNTLFGVYPGLFSLKRRKFVFSKVVAAYCFTVASIFGLFYIWHIYKELSEGRINRRHTIGIYCYMNVTVCLINFITQWPIIKPVLQFQNRVPLFEVLNSLDMSMMLVWRAFIYAVLKILVCPLVEYITLILYQRRAHPELRCTSFATVRTMLPLIVSNQINNCFFGGLVIVNLIVAAINKMLLGIVKEANMLQTPGQMDLQKPYYRMRRFCDLADGLDELAIKFGLAACYSQGYLRFTDWSMILSMLMNLIGITMGFYNQYLAIADYYINEEPFDLFLAIDQLVFLVVPFMELVMVARISNQMLQETKRTGDLLQRFDLQHADVRFKQVVNAFWLQVSTINYKLMPLGLLELNTSLVNTIFSAVIGYLLILIQSDLTLRFSLK
ncbi:hypothetical protein KR054_004236 [Drosophila jambulina]|nr:hypothetical protein KR054_004236 [Drosophila jambulina]